MLSEVKGVERSKPTERLRASRGREHWDREVKSRGFWRDVLADFPIQLAPFAIQLTEFQS